MEEEEDHEKSSNCMRMFKEKDESKRKKHKG